MVARFILIFFLSVFANAQFISDKSLTSKILLKTIECDPNRIYQKDDVTCFCNEYGRWPHKNCSLVFHRDPRAICKPNSFVQIGCNVCRCSKTGRIQEEFCTKHLCKGGRQKNIIRRRFTSTRTKCTLNHWYEISSCRLCICITKENLLCAPAITPTYGYLGKLNVSDCGITWLKDINKLLSSINPLRLGMKGETQIMQISEPDTAIEEKEISIDQIQTKPSHETSTIDLKPSIVNPENIDYIGNVNIARNDARNDDVSDEVGLDSSGAPNSNENLEGKSIARVSGTAMPFDNEEENEKNESNNSNDIESDKKDSDVSAPSKKDSEEVSDEAEPVESRSNINENEPDLLKNENEKNDIEEDDDKSFLKLNLPGVLGKVFNFGIRRSKVSLDDSHCEPGTAEVIKCNTCFCLNNGKLLCTKKICE